MAKWWSRVRGFTLVELLIVVAIVGVLATVGVPTFRKMVQKAKKSEAKVGLGGLYTVEAAFFSEYGTYGTNIDKVGFELDGTASTRIYHTGFPSSTCATAITIQPDKTVGQGSALNISFPSYYTATYVGVINTTAPNAPVSNCLAASMDTKGQTFNATASGTISTKGTAVDTWKITENRVLSNENDGTQ